MVGLVLRSGNSPRLIIFEDMHWFDEAWLNLLKSVVSRLPHLLIVVSRHWPESMVTTGGYVADERTLEITPREIPAHVVAEIMRRRLRATERPPALVKFVQAHPGGEGTIGRLGGATP